MADPGSVGHVFRRAFSWLPAQFASQSDAPVGAPRQFRSTEHLSIEAIAAFVDGELRMNAHLRAAHHLRCVPNARPKWTTKVVPAPLCAIPTRSASPARCSDYRPRSRVVHLKVHLKVRLEVHPRARPTGLRQASATASLTAMAGNRGRQSRVRR